MSNFEQGFQPGAEGPAVTADIVSSEEQEKNELVSERKRALAQAEEWLKRIEELKPGYQTYFIGVGGDPKDADRREIVDLENKLHNLATENGVIVEDSMASSLEIVQKMRQALGDVSE